MRYLDTIRIGVITAISIISVTAKANAQVELNGYFVARAECPAYQSFRKQTNPGSATTVKGRSYEMLGKNGEAASHYLIKIPGASPEQRWVAIGCGEHVPQAAGSEKQVERRSAARKDRSLYVLALSWQPAFCETKPEKIECRTMTPDRFDASHFALHGLWPQPGTNVYCRVGGRLVSKDKSGDWESLPEPELDPEIKASLAKTMPGTASLLHRHEWIKHGTCYHGKDAGSYFRDALRITDAVNASPVRDFFAANIGRMVRTPDIAKTFDEAFGAGAGLRIKVACTRDGSRLLIREITLGLAGDLSGEASIPDAIIASPPTRPECPGGIIDPVGLQ